MPHPASALLVELFAIFVAAKLFGEIFERLRLPAVLGEVLAGALLGPYALRLITPNETVYSIAELGAIFLDRKSTRLNSSHIQKSRMPSSA